jgi:hypothetical protein
MGWAGPAQPTGPDSAQNCWADFGPKLLGRFRPKMDWADLGPKEKYSLGPNELWDLKFYLNN